jgi:hypothetical protein
MGILDLPVDYKLSDPRCDRRHRGKRILVRRRPLEEIDAGERNLASYTPSSSPPTLYVSCLAGVVPLLRDQASFQTRGNEKIMNLTGHSSKGVFGLTFGFGFCPP